MEIYMSRFDAKLLSQLTKIQSETDVQERLMNIDLTITRAQLDRIVEVLSRPHPEISAIKIYKENGYSIIKVMWDKVYGAFRVVRLTPFEEDLSEFMFHKEPVNNIEKYLNDLIENKKILGYERIIF